MAAWADTESLRRRRAPRTEIRLECVLTRPKGAPIACHTLDVGPGGMRVLAERPLGVDEVLHFDLPVRGAHVIGDARVLREQGQNVYALRFESIGDGDMLHLGTLAA
jgi:hypothetical protein